MLNKKLKLNTKVFDNDIEKVATRVGFGSGLLKAGGIDQSVVGLCCDLTGSTKMDSFANKFPERFVQIGVAEQNMASVASGMAAMGKIPFISSYAMFSPGRNWEQIRTTICYNDSNVKIVGSHAGISVGPDGGTHQALEDIALMRVLPNMSVVYPCDYLQAHKATLWAAKYPKPAYIRLAREATPVITTEDTLFEFGKAQIIFETKAKRGIIGKKKTLGIISSGPLLYNALMVAKKISKEGYGVRLLNIHTIKPLDEKALLDLALISNAVLTIEAHQRAGGLGSSISEFLSQNYPVKMKIMGVDDKFGQSGTPDELIEHYGLGVENILKEAKILLG